MASPSPFSILEDIEKLCEPGDGIVRVKIIRKFVTFGVIPTARQSKIVGASDVAAKTITYNQTVFLCNTRDVVKYILKKPGIRLTATNGFRDKDVLEVGRQR